MKGQGKYVVLTRKNGTLKGVKAQIYNPDKEKWEKSKDFIGYVVGDDTFLIGHGEREDGYELELEISEQALRNMLDKIVDEKERLKRRDRFSEDPYPDKFDWLEGDFPT